MKNNKKSIAFFERGSWYHRYKKIDSNGIVKYSKLGGFKTEKEAEASYYKYLEEFEKDMVKYQITIDKNILFSDYMKYWFEELYSQRVESTTKIVGSYIVYDLILPSIEYDIKINLVNSEYLDKILENACKKTSSGGYSAKTYLSIAFKDAVRNGYISINPVSKTKVYYRPKPNIVVYNKEELKIFLSEARKTNWYLEILLGLFCGLRKGEITGLQFNDFNLDNHTVSIERQIATDANTRKGTSELIDRKQVVKQLKTPNSYRTIKVPNVIVNELKERKIKYEDLKNSYQGDFIDDGFISCQENGDAHNLSSINTALIKISKRTNLKRVTVHGLRHMFATILLEQGVTLPKISAILGHSSIHTTFEYYCEIMDEENKILAFLNNEFSVGEI